MAVRVRALRYDALLEDDVDGDRHIVLVKHAVLVRVNAPAHERGDTFE